MLVLELDNDRIHSILGHNVITGSIDTGLLPNAIYQWWGQTLPPIALAYDYLLAKGFDSEAIIDSLLQIYLKYAEFRTGMLKDMSLVMAFVGMRGAGKSLSATRVAILDYLLKGMPVYSNMPIKVKVTYKSASKVFESQPLDKLQLLDVTSGYNGACLLVDEINMELAEGSRYMSNANLAFGYVIQQLRKRKLSLLYTVQGWGWVDTRLRWQTDYVIECSDKTLQSHDDSRLPGTYTRWLVDDLSGLTGRFDDDYNTTHRFASDFRVWEGTVFNKIFWPAYETETLQGQTNYHQEFKSGLTEPQRLESIEAKQLPYKQFAIELRDRAIEHSASVSGGPARFYCSALWEQNGITDRADQTNIGSQILQAGFTKKRDSKGKYYYELSAKNELGSLTNS